jgi:hypothetical protein
MFGKERYDKGVYERKDDNTDMLKVCLLYNCFNREGVLLF